MRITKSQLREFIRECGEMPELHVGVSDMPVPTVDPALAVAALEESQSPEGELVVEMEVASRNLELAVESINAAASLCPSCVEEVAAAAPLLEAVVTQAQALQETLDAVGAVISENTETDISVSL
jgi:hypothetical protein